MLSYMLPVDEKPPPGPPKTHLVDVASPPKDRLQLALAPAPSREPLTNGAMSKDTSVSSFASDATTTTISHSSMTPTSVGTDKGKPKLIINGGKHQSLKRVSFGSSKGSMVETLIFESTVQEEPEPSPIPENGTAFQDLDQSDAEREKVRVTFFQQSKPLEVDLPDEPIFSEPDFMMASPVTINDSNHAVYNRTESTESGWDNPFRPGGDLSREADEIVELIKGGKPITPTPGSQAPPLPSLDQSDAANHTNNLPPADNVPPKKTAGGLSAAPLSNSTPKTNGTAKGEGKTAPGAVDVQRITVKPDGDGTQIEHVVIKKKPKCKCCVIQ